LYAPDETVKPMKLLKVHNISFLALVLFFNSCSKPSEEKNSLPTVTGFTPASGSVNSTIYITGSGFSSLEDSAGCIKVFFQNKEACASVKNDDTLEVAVPFDAGDGSLCVAYNGTKYCTSQSFNYLPGNPASNTFIRLADCPSTPTNQVAVMAATDNGIIAGFINWWRYDIDKNSWSNMPAPTDKLTRVASFTWNGKAYLFGGYNAGFSNRLQCYDPVTNSWSFKTPMPSTSRADAVAFVWNNKVYIAGGIDNFSYGMNTVYNQLWQYDPVADSWQRKADLPIGAAEGSYALRVGSKFYIASVGNSVQEYDPQTNTWMQFPPGEILPAYAAPYSDKDFPLGYTIGGVPGYFGTGEVKRYAINYASNHFITEMYAQAPNGYATAGAPFYAVVNNELYYGMAYQNVNGVQVRDNQLWRYRY
jgi:hypothetical protein